MNTSSKTRSAIIYTLFLVMVIVLTAISTLAQSTSRTNSVLSFPAFSSLSNTPENYHVVDLPVNFDYNNLKVEIFGSDGEVRHSYACYSISERSFVIDLTSFTNGTYSINVVNGSSTFFQVMTVSK